MGHWGQAEEQEGGEEDRHQTAVEETAHESAHESAHGGNAGEGLPEVQDVTSGQ
jgi:hypothetical protein